MATKQITELESANSIEDGDLLLVRKSGMGVDRKLTKDKLVESLGNTAVHGYIATSGEDNKIELVASNKSVITEYVEAMRICFISPITTTGTVEIKISNLPHIPLEKYNVDETVELVEHEYVEAVYTNGKFRQTNKLNTNLIWSNEYTATGETEGLLPGIITIYTLTSAIGVKKTEYYEGMSLMFTVPIDSQGSIFVDVDGLGRKFLNNSDNYFTNNLYKNQLVLAVFDGENFVTHKMPTIEEPAPIIAPDPEVIPPLPTEADDPAAADNPNAVDSEGNKIFKRVLEVGEDQECKTISAAITKLRNEYGDKGNGNNYAILLNNYVPPKVEMIGAVTSAFKQNLNFDWISIFSKDNIMINLKTCYFRFDCNRTPVLNARFNIQIGIAETDYLTAGRSPFENYGSGQIILGKNFECILQANVTGFTGQLRTYMFYNSGFHPTQTAIIAKYGYKFTTNLALGFAGFHSLELSNGDITLQQKVTPSTSNYRQSIHFQSDGEHYMANTIVHSTLNSEPVFTTYSTTILNNVNARARNNNSDGINVLSYTSTNSLTMEDCTFDHASETNKDVVINGTKDTRIYLKNTVVSTNQDIGVETDKGLIQNID